ncbi:MAG: ORF6N domain-containing protein [bacterium]
MKKIIPKEMIEKKILIIRGHKVMIDRDLADMYGVKTKILIQSVKRNIERFPDDFMFQLIWKEIKSLRSQFVTLKDLNGAVSRRGKHIKYQPYVFTEQGVVMLSSVLRSKRAIQVNIAIMRAFVKLRQFAISHAELAIKLKTLEKKYDAQFKVVFEAIRQLMIPPEKAKRKIGFSKG